MEVLERCLMDERLLCLRIKEEEEKKLVNGGLGVAHGRASTGTGRANFLDFCLFWVGKVRHGRATTGTGRAKSLVLGGSKFLFS